MRDDVSPGPTRPTTADKLQLIDISRPVHPSMTTWEDRFPVDVHWHSRFLDGQATANSTWTVNTHTGTHADAPFHHLPDGRVVEELDLNTFVGRCRVLDLTDREEGSLTGDDLARHHPRAGERLLLKTRNSLTVSGAGVFQRDYCALSPSAARLLADLPVRLVGIDCLSVEPYRPERFEVHRSLLRADVGVLEGLDLGEVDAGSYDLLALPVRWQDAEAAPVRAVLIPTPPSRPEAIHAD